MRVLLAASLTVACCFSEKLVFSDDEESLPSTDK